MAYRYGDHKQKSLFPDVSHTDCSISCGTLEHGDNPEVLPVCSKEFFRGSSCDSVQIDELLPNLAFFPTKRIDSMKNKSLYYNDLETSAPLAQLDRVADFESELLLVSAVLAKV